MWEAVRVMPTRQADPRTERPEIQQSQFTEFGLNGTHQLTISWKNRMARKCEPAWQSMQQEKSNQTRNVPRISGVNDFSSPSSLGMEPVSLLSADQRERQVKEMWASVTVMPTREDEPIHVPRRRSFNDFLSPCSLRVVVKRYVVWVLCCVFVFVGSAARHTNFHVVLTKSSSLRYYTYRRLLIFAYNVKASAARRAAVS